MSDRLSLIFTKLNLLLIFILILPVEFMLMSYTYTTPLLSVRQILPSSSSNIPYTGSRGESCKSSKGCIDKSETNLCNGLVWMAVKSSKSFNELNEKVEETGCLKGLLLDCNSWVSYTCRVRSMQFVTISRLFLEGKRRSITLESLFNSLESCRFVLSFTVVNFHNEMMLILSSVSI